jgi:hypothetical protein
MIHLSCVHAAIMKRITLVAVLAATVVCNQSYAVDPSCDGHQSTTDEIGQALYTIFLEAARTEMAIPAPPLMSLDRAASIIFCDPDPVRRRGRMRYAATKLVAGHAILTRKDAPPARIKRFADALERLNFPKAMVMAVSAAPPGPPSGTIVELEREVAKLIDNPAAITASAFQRACCPCIDDCDVGVSDGIATVEFEIDVSVPVKDLFRMIDPVSWKGLLPMYFTMTDEIAGAPACQAAQPVCLHTGGPCRTGTDPAPISATSPHQPGYPWCGLLHEKFKAEWESTKTTATFDNVLGVRTKYLPAGATFDLATGYRMDFKLCESLGHTVGGVGDDCGLVEDCGFSQVSDDMSGTQSSYLFGTKRVSFLSSLNPDANAWAPIAMEVMVKETALTACGGRGDEKDTPCTCAEDECTQHRTFAPTWTADFCQ